MSIGQPAVGHVGWRSPTAQRMLLQGAALGTFAAAATHASVMPVHFQQSWMYGTFFLCAMTAQFVWGAWVLGRPDERLVRAGVAGSVAVIVLWAFSRGVSVPVGPDNGATEPVGALDVLATVAESVTVMCGILVLRGRGFRPAWRWSDWSAIMRVAVAVAVAVVGYLTWVVPKS